MIEGRMNVKQREQHSRASESYHGVAVAVITDYALPSVAIVLWTNTLYCIQRLLL